MKVKERKIGCAVNLGWITVSLIIFKLLNSWFFFIFNCIKVNVEYMVTDKRWDFLNECTEFIDLFFYIQARIRIIALKKKKEDNRSIEQEWEKIC